MFRRFQSSWEVFFLAIWRCYLSFCCTDCCGFSLYKKLGCFSSPAPSFFNWAANTDTCLVARGLFSNMYCKIYAYFDYLSVTQLCKKGKVLCHKILQIYFVRDVLHIEETKCFLSSTNVCVNFVFIYFELL